MKIQGKDQKKKFILSQTRGHNPIFKNEGRLDKHLEPFIKGKESSIDQNVLDKATRTLKYPLRRTGELTDYAKGFLR